MKKPGFDQRKLLILVEELQRGPKTYEELQANRLLALSRRSLQNYLESALPSAGFEVARGLTAGPVPRATFSVDAPPQEAAVVSRAAPALAQGVLRGLFPIEGTPLDPSKGGRSRVLAFARGVPELEDSHLRAVFKWITASEKPQPCAVWLRYLAANKLSGQQGAEPERRLVWPVGVLLREGRKVYLSGLVEPAGGLEDARNFALERVVAGEADGEPDCGVKVAAASFQRPSPWLSEHRPWPREMVDAPFALVRPDVATTKVRVRVRFDPSQAAYLRGRRWHSKQKTQDLGDGSLDLAFGPTDLGEALGWCGQWLRGLTVLGDATFRAEWEKLLRARLAAQGALSLAHPRKGSAPGTAPRAARTP